MKKTSQERIVERLCAGGDCEEVTSTSKKYRKLIRQSDGEIYWVGMNGALRVGPTISNSISLTAMLERS